MNEKEMKLQSFPDHAPSMLPCGNEWKLVWNDEFDLNHLDTEKWGFRTHFWGHESPTWIKEEGLSFDGQSHLKMNLVRKGDDFYSTHLQTGSMTFDMPKDTDGFWPFGKLKKPTFMHRYGYYEVRCKLPKNAGWHAAFWLQAPGIGSHPDNEQCGVEVDIMESYRVPHDGMVICGCGYGGYGKDCVFPGHFQFPFRETEDGWHYYGVKWDKEGFTFYADGEKIGFQGHPDNPTSHVDEFLILSTECHGYHRFFGGDAGCIRARADGNDQAFNGSPTKDLLDAQLPDCFEVDFVRVYDAVE